MPELTLRIHPLHAEAGDVLVFKLPASVSSQEADQVREAVNEALDGTNVRGIVVVDIQVDIIKSKDSDG